MNGKISKGYNRVSRISITKFFVALDTHDLNYD